MSRTPSVRPIFPRRGRVIFFWRTDLEVDWERTQNYYVGLLALYLSRIENRANFFVYTHILATKHHMQS